MTYEDKVISARTKVQSIETQLRIAKFELSQVLDKCPHEWKDSPIGRRLNYKIYIIVTYYHSLVIALYNKTL